MPVDELGVDAAVLFADIMLPLEPMGVGRRDRARGRADHRRADPVGGRRRGRSARSIPARACRSRSRRSACVRRELDGGAGVIGFCRRAVHAGLLPDRGPAVAGLRDGQGVHVSRAGRVARADGAPDDDDRRLPAGAGRRPARRSSSCSTAGSAGSGPADYGRFVQPHVRPDLRVRCRDVPTIHFGTGTAALLEAMADAGGDVIGRRPPRRRSRMAWARVGDDRGVQGNLDAGAPARRLGRRPRTGAHVGARRRPAVARATSSTSATACCPRPTRTCSAGSSTWSTSRRRGRRSTRRRHA